MVRQILRTGSFLLDRGKNGGEGIPGEEEKREEGNRSR